MRESSANTRRPAARFLMVCAIAGAVAASSGCEFLGLSGETETPPTQPEQEPTPPGDQPPAEPVEQPTPARTAPAEEYQRPEYPNMARRNPFQPDLEVVKPTNLPADSDERTLEPLERFSLGELDLVAIISEVAVPKAMFIDPEGFGHVLKEGDRIGRNSGVLSDVRDNEVEITESSEEDRGQTRLRTIKLRDVELSTGGSAGLSEEERAALEKLLSTDQGQEALERFRRDLALGANTVEGERQQSNQQQNDNARPRDRRFPGIRPPSQNQE